MQSGRGKRSEISTSNSKNPKGKPQTQQVKSKPPAFHNVALKLSKEDKAKLRKIKEQTNAMHVDGCYLRENVVRLQVPIEREKIEAYAASVIGQLNDQLSFIPKTGGISHGTIFFYLCRAFAWYFHRAGMIDMMPQMNFDNYALPAWLGIVLHAHAPYEKRGVRISYDVNGLSDADIDGWSQTEGSVYPYDGGNVLAQVSSQGGEELFGPGLLIAGTDKNLFSKISSLFSTLASSVRVKDIPVRTKNTEMYYNQNGYCLKRSSRWATCFLLLPNSMFYQGMRVVRDVSQNDQMVAMTLMHQIGWNPNISLAGAARFLGVAPETYYRVNYTANFPWYSMMIADFLVANSDVIPLTDTNWWRHFRALYVTALCYYLSFVPYVAKLKNGLSTPCYRIPAHRTVLMASSYASAQKAGIFVQDGVVYVLEAPTVNNFWSMDSMANITEYTGTAGNMLQFYFAGPVAWDIFNPGLPPGQQVFNVVPLGTLDTFTNAVREIGLTLYKMVQDPMVRCLCYTPIEKIVDQQPVGEVTILYRSISGVYCNGGMDRNQCCWMLAGGMLNSVEPITLFTNIHSDRSNKLRSLSEAATLRGATVTSVGQKRNISAAYMGVTKNQYTGATQTAYQFLTSPEVRGLVTNYLAENQDSIPAPSSTALQQLLNGELTLPAAVGLMAGATIRYGPQIMSLFRRIRVVTEL